MNIYEIASRIYQHAHDNWDKDGWDFIYECHDPKSLAECLMEGADPDHVWDYETALAQVAEVAGVLDERRREVRAEIF